MQKLHILPVSIARSIKSKFYFTGAPCRAGHVCNRRTVNATCVICEGIKKDEVGARKRAETAARIDAEILASSTGSRALHCISRKDAINAGLLKYFTGLPCVRGHVDELYVSGFACLSCSKWKIETDKERKSEYDRIYRAQDPEKCLQRSLAWTAANREKSNQIKKRWAERNPESAIVQQSRRRAAKASSTGKHTIKDVREILEKQRCMCASCFNKLKKTGKNRYHVDHIMPLAKGGSNGRENIQILCPPCNLKKSAKDPYLFAQSMGRLF